MTEPNILAGLEVSPPIARLNDPRTSHRAAGNIDYKSRRAQVMRSILESPAYGRTTVEIAKHLNITRDAVSPNMKPLERLGYVRREGQRLNKDSGNFCEIWHLTEKGRAVAGQMMPIARKPDHICICKICGSHS